MSFFPRAPASLLHIKQNLQKAVSLLPEPEGGKMVADVLAHTLASMQGSCTMS